VIDVRPIDAYARSHVPGALSIALRDAFAVWLGWLVPEDAALLFVGDAQEVSGATDEALLVGYERFAGSLDGGMRSWEAAGLPVKASGLVNTAVARGALVGGAVALDVRERDEYAARHIPDAVHVPLGELARRIDEVPRDRPVVAYCGHGERAATAASILERAGIEGSVNLEGGIDAWREAGLPGAAA